MGIQLPSPKGGRAPFQFTAHVYCGQRAGWFKIALGMEVNFSPGDFVLDEDPASIPKKGAEPSSLFSALFVLWPNDWMHQDATWYGSRPQPIIGDFVLDRDLVPLPRKGA